MTNEPTPAKAQKVTRPGLRHAHAGMKDSAFFIHIDDCGGWPLDYPYVGFAHSDEREAAFTMEPIHHGWWTTLYHRDDYLMWKLSPAAWDRIFDGVREDLMGRMRYQKPLAQGPRVQGWGRSVAPLHSDFAERSKAS